MVKHCVELTSKYVRHINIAPYHTGSDKEDLQKTEINKMLWTNVVQPAQSELALLVVTVPKEYGSLCLQIDFRTLKTVTVVNTFPILQMDECLDSIDEECNFATLEASYGPCK